MGSLVFDDQTLVAHHARHDGRFLNRPGTDVRPLFIVSLDVLLCVRGLPSSLPIVCELFQEGSFKSGWLFEYC